MNELRDSREECPHCGAQLQGEPIPEKSRHLFDTTKAAECAQIARLLANK